jgi:hypothetical protein
MQPSLRKIKENIITASNAFSEGSVGSIFSFNKSYDTAGLSPKQHINRGSTTTTSPLPGRNKNAHSRKDGLYSFTKTSGGKEGIVCINELRTVGKRQQNAATLKY